MKPAPFKYIAPTTLEEALDALAKYGYDAKLLAGGQSLIPVMNFRLAQPAVLIDLNGVKEMDFLQVDRENGVRIGGMTRQSRLEFSEIIREHAPLLSEVMPQIAHPQIRNRGTIGGSLAHADPAAELPVITVALGARFRLQRQGGDRWIDADGCYEALFLTVLEAEEILVEVDVPPLRANTGYAFQEFSRRHGDFALAGVAAVITLDGDGRVSRARLVYLNVGEIPMVASKAAAAMVGERPTPELIEHVAQMASKDEIEPAADIHGTAAYKHHLATVLGKRTIQVAVDRARSGIEL
ncbi:MAG: xanthine dehydrogenase family protein subunit M [Chloroflexi bacterium]|jgi:carbon-monoxide dehydrogenase medium subunit|nr:xanthine dehydrogenase family protein subunit M [Chloroflexota bacterium]